MYKRTIWILVSLLMAVTLIIASCDTKTEEKSVEEDDEGKVVITETEVHLDGEKVEEEGVTVPTDEPQYGGTLTVPLTGDILYFTSLGYPMEGWTFHITNQMLLDGDWSRGPAGTGEFTWYKGSYGDWNSVTGRLAESWDIPEVGTIIFNIRHGVHFYMDPDNEASVFVGGREFTGEDVSVCLNLLKDVPGSAPFFSPFREAQITALDKWTVEVKLPPALFDEVRTTMMYCPLFAPELAESEYNMADWENNVGTGAFILKDYTPSSSAYLVKNPDYWETDPCGPGEGNQLPYIDAIRMMIISDQSTRTAGFRTGKIDIYHGMNREDIEIVWNSNPEVSYVSVENSAFNCIGMRQDKEELPYSDIRVRHAMMLATDFETIRDTLGHGEGQILTWPILYEPETAPAYMGFDDPEMPEAVKELYVYNPEKAKTLLADAGYPSGFPARMAISNIAADIDYASILVDQWSKVGIDVTLETMEGGAYTALRNNREYDELIYGAGMPQANMFIGSAFNGETRAGNLSHVDDPIVQQAILDWNPYTISEPLKAMEIWHDLMPYVLEQAWTIPGVVWPTYNCWWPWMGNFSGENTLGRTLRAYTKYIWIDESLKESMGY
ncbi:MAG: ABC transporter substrate-binding protein [Dehalococcoidales bacterium]|nr:ABC transporter substrate-binding protein [Dehalococcoidales bacterium]